MITDAKARDLATLWHTGHQSALYQFATQAYYCPEKSVLYLWEILQQLQNEYFLPCPKHPVYGYLYPDAVAGADDFATFETIKVPV
jgi:hypothetical protein